MLVELVRNRYPFKFRVWIEHIDEFEINNHEISIHVNGNWITFSSNDFSLYCYPSKARINYNDRYLLKSDDTYEVLCKHLGCTLDVNRRMVVKGGHKWE